MRRIDEEAYFLIGFFPLFSQDYYSQSDACNGYDNHCIEYQRPETEPEGLLDNDVHTAFLQDNTTVFVGDGTYAEGIVARTQVGKTDDVFLSRTAPTLIEAFQFPGVQN